MPINIVDMIPNAAVHSENVLNRSDSDDYPNGNVQTALDELKKEFTESTMITKRKMTKAF